MTSQHVDVSIILVNYRTPKLTSECIHSIFNNVKSCTFEIILVDNASGDDSIKLFKEKFGSNVHIIDSGENLGFGRANNLGVAKSCGEFVFFLNSDTILKNDPFKYFLYNYKTLDSAGVLGTYLIDGSDCYTLSGGNTYSAQKYIKVALNGIFRRKSPIEIPFSSKIQKVDYVIGADMFMSRELFQEVGGFNPRIFMYFEDVELCERISRLGKNNYLIPGPQIIHFVKSSSTSQFSRVYNTASLMYCLSNKMPSIRFKAFQLIYLLLKLPLILNFKNIKNEWQYITSIYKYKKYLAK